jgi:hypothetical protein
VTDESVPAGHLRRQRITVTRSEQDVCRGVLALFVGDR